MTITDLKEANENLRNNYEARENMVKVSRRKYDLFLSVKMPNDLLKSLNE